MLVAFLVIYSAFLRIRGEVLGIVGEFILFFVFADVVLGIKLKFFTGLQCFKVFGGVLYDVGGLVAEDFAGEVGEDFLKACWDWVFLEVFASHAKLYLLNYLISLISTYLTSI